MISAKLAEQIVERVTRAAAPAKIVLFGSQARRDCRRGSDIDLALYERSPEFKKLEGVLARKLETL